MKCFLCSSTFENQEDLLHHYISYHNVDENNWFFQKLFQLKNKTILKQCIRCNKFLTTDKQESIHNFLKHYDEGKKISFEDKPIEVLRFPGLTIYAIEFQKHFRISEFQDFYKFFNSEEVVDDFLRNGKYKFESGGTKWIKSSITIENIQQSLYQDLKPLIKSRYWTTPPYEGAYFNDFIFFALKQNILSRVIINGMTGSSWYFKCFVSLSLKVLDNNIEAVT